MNNWGVDGLNSSSINRASEISDISFTWIIVNSHESITVPCATKNRVLINQWGHSRVRTGGWCCLLLKLLFSVQHNALGSHQWLFSIIPLIDFCVTTNGRSGGGRQQTLNRTFSAQSLPKCIPHISASSRPFDSARNIFSSFFTSSILDLNISVMTATHFLFMPTMTGGFRQFSSIYLERKPNPFEIAWRSSALIAFVTAQQVRYLVWRVCPPDLPSSLLHWKPTQAMGIAWPHSCTGCKGRQVHLHTITTDGRIPFQLHFRSRGKDPVVHITVAETNLAEMEREMEKAHLLH